MTTTPERRFALPAVLVTATLAALSLVTQWNVDGNRRLDFRIYYRSVESIDTIGLYGYGTGVLRFVYPPIAAAVVWPLTALDESVAARWWLVASVIAFVVAYGCAFARPGGRFALPPWAPLVLGALALWTVPAASSLRFGQINPLVTVLLCVDMVLIERKGRWGGVLTGVAAALKVTPLAIVPILFAGSKRCGWRCVASFTAITLATAAIAPHATVEFAERLVSGAAERGGHSVDLRTVLRQVLPGTALADGVWIVASIALVVAGALRARRLPTVGGRPDAVGLITIGACLSYVISPLSWVHHLTLVVVALFLWATRSTNVWQRVAAVVGLIGVLEPSAGTSTLSSGSLVLFCILTVVALPAGTSRPPISAAGPDSPKMFGAPEEERASHV